MPQPPTCPCASLPPESMHVDVDARPNLLAVLEPIDREPGLATYFRCRVCGTHWENTVASAMHADVLLFRRSELDEHGRPKRLLIDLATGARVPLRR